LHQTPISSVPSVPPLSGGAELPPQLHQTPISSVPSVPPLSGGAELPPQLHQTPISSVPSVQPLSGGLLPTLRNRPETSRTRGVIQDQPTAAKQYTGFPGNLQEAGTGASRGESRCQDDPDHSQP
jgi:hypothetical protein